MAVCQWETHCKTWYLEVFARLMETLINRGRQPAFPYGICFERNKFVYESGLQAIRSQLPEKGEGVEIDTYTPLQGTTKKE
jgi:hypothetical protein